MKRKKRWMVMMGLLVLISIWGVLTPETPDLWLPDEYFNSANVAWMITATIFVLMMTPGLSFFYGGMVGRKNVISTILQSFIAMGIISVLWVVIGFSLAFGYDLGHFIGNPLTFPMFTGVGAKTDLFLAPTIPLALYALFQMKFAIITPSLITGSFAERVHFSGYLVFLALFSIFVYCPLAHWTWHPDGFLRQMGVLDFAGEQDLLLLLSRFSRLRRLSCLFPVTVTRRTNTSTVVSASITESRSALIFSFISQD